MAGERALPGLGIRAFHTPESDGWNETYDPDLRKLSALTQAAVISRSTSLPGSPTDGDIYIVPTADANGDDIAVRDNGEWIFFTPNEGFLVHVNDTDEYVKWTGTAWEALVTAPSGGSPIVIESVTAAYDVTNTDLGGTRIKEVDSASAVTVTVPTGLTGDQPCQFVQIGAGQVTFSPAVGVTIKAAGGSLTTRVQYSSATIYRRGADDYVLIGDLVV